MLGVGGVGKSTVATRLFERISGQGTRAELIRFDELRKSLTPAGQDPFSKDPAVKLAIYEKALDVFKEKLDGGTTLVIDSGMSNEAVRKWVKQQDERIKIVWVRCPLPVAVWRDTLRSLKGARHERGSFLHLRAIKDLINPFKKRDEKFPQPGITYSFDKPECADVVVRTFPKSPARAADDVLRKIEVLCESAAR